MLPSNRLDLGILGHRMYAGAEGISGIITLRVPHPADSDDSGKGSNPLMVLAIQRHLSRGDRFLLRHTLEQKGRNQD